MTIAWQMPRGRGWARLTEHYAYMYASVGANTNFIEHITSSYSTKGDLSENLYPGVGHLSILLEEVKVVPLGSKGWQSGESARLPPMSPGFNSRRRRHMWVEFVVGSLPCSERFFSGYSGFPSPQKPTLPNSNSIWNARTRLNEFIGTPRCFLGKQAIYNFIIFF